MTLDLAPSPTPLQPTPTPTVKRYAPVYSCLGIEMHGREPRYVVAANGVTAAYRAGEMASLNWLLNTYSDVAHWRNLFGTGRGRKIDTKRAAGWFISKCREAGPYLAGPPAP